MNKIIGFGVVIFALFVALWYLLTRQHFTFELAKENSFFKKRILTTAAILLTFFSQNRLLASVAKVQLAGLQYASAKGKIQHDIEEIDDWQQLKKMWTVLREAKPLPFTGELDGVSESQKKLQEKYLSSVVEKGFLSQNAAIIVNYVYGELLYHRLRSNSGATCYKMTVLGGTMAGVGEDLKNRLEVLSEVSKKGSVSESVLAEARGNISRDVAFMSKAEKFFRKNEPTTYDDAYWQEEKALTDLFKDGKVAESIKVEETVSEAVRYIMLLNTDGKISGVKRPSQGIEKLKKSSEWAGVKANWHHVSKIENQNFAGLEHLIAEKKNENWSLLLKLINAGLLDVEGARVFNAIYGDRIYHRLRPMMATCYVPSLLGMKQQETRNSLENRLKQLAEVSPAGLLKEEVLRQAQKNLQKELEVVLRINELWEKSKNTGWDTYAQEEKEILAFFTKEDYTNVEISDSITIRKGVKEAMKIMQLIYEAVE